MRKLPVEVAESFMSVVNIDAPAPFPVLETTELTVAFVLKQGITSAVGEQAKGVVPHGLKEIFVMPEQLSFSRHKETKEDHLYASIDMAVLFMKRHKDGDMLIEDQAVLAMGHSKIVYPSGSAQAFARLSMGQATEEDIALLRDSPSGMFCSHNIKVVQPLTQELADRLIKDGDVPPDFTFDEHTEPVVSSIPKEFEQMMEQVVEYVAEKGMDDIGKVFINYFIDNPEMIRQFDQPVRTMDQLKMGRQKALSRLQENARENGVPVNEHALLVTNGTFDELEEEAQSDPAESLHKTIDMLITLAGEGMSEEDKEKQRHDIKVYSDLMKLNHARALTSIYNMPELLEKMDTIQDELALELSESGKELYDTKLKEELENIHTIEEEGEEPEEGSFEAFMQEMRESVNEKLGGAERADLTRRQVEEQIESNPHLKSVIESILAERGATRDDVEITGEIHVPKKDKE